MNPAGRVPGSKYFSVFRQSFVRDGWEVIDTPPLTNQGKTSADTHIVMDVLDSVTQFPHVSEYVLLAADADYTPLIIRLRKYMKTTVIYAPAAMSVAYRAACDSVIEDQEMLNLLREDEEPEEAAPAQTVIIGEATPEKIKHTVDRYFAESEPDHKANVATLGHLLIKQFPGIEKGWANHPSLSQLLRKVCLLNVQKVENRTLAWKSDESAA